MQLPLEQDGALFVWAVPQVTLQAPQLDASAATDFSQPLFGLPSQSS